MSLGRNLKVTVWVKGSGGQNLWKIDWFGRKDDWKNEKNWVDGKQVWILGIQNPMLSNLLLETEQVLEVKESGKIYVKCFVDMLVFL